MISNVSYSCDVYIFKFCVKKHEIEFYPGVRMYNDNIVMIRLVEWVHVL